MLIKDAIENHLYAKFISLEDIYISSLVILSGYYLSHNKKMVICFNLKQCIDSISVRSGLNIQIRLKLLK